MGFYWLSTNRIGNLGLSHFAFILVKDLNTGELRMNNYHIYGEQITERKETLSHQLTPPAHPTLGIVVSYKNKANRLTATGRCKKLI